MNSECKVNVNNDDKNKVVITIEAPDKILLNNKNTTIITALNRMITVYTAYVKIIAKSEKWTQSTKDNWAESLSPLGLAVCEKYIEETGQTKTNLEDDFYGFVNWMATHVERWNKNLKVTRNES
jgi:hypothetical protein